MTDSGERSYAYAKACALIGKSYLSSRVNSLLGIKRLSELDHLIFPQTPDDLPERPLSTRFERRLFDRSAERIAKILKAFNKPPAFLIRLLRVYEYTDVKACLAALSDGKKNAPPYTALGEYGTVRFSAYPDWLAMVADTEFAVFEAPAASTRLSETENAIDAAYYKALWADISRLPGRERNSCAALIAEELALKNVMTSLRLRVYYRSSEEELEARLINPDPRKAEFTSAARQCVNFPLDQREEWAKWPYAKLLNPPVQGEYWSIDPRYIQNAAARYLYKNALVRFRFHPFGLDGLAAFVRLLQYEEDLLTSVAEGLTIGVSVKDVYSALGVSA